MATYTKLPLSSSLNGRPILIAAAHTLVHSTLTGGIDEVWLYAYNSSLLPARLIVEFGGGVVPNDQISQEISSQNGLSFIIPGLVLAPNGTVLTIRALTAPVGGVVTISGYVNRIL